MNWTEIRENQKRPHSVWNYQKDDDRPNAACRRVFPEADLFAPRIEPKFTIPRGAAVFTVGSCFAREIEKVLWREGVSIPAVFYENSAHVENTNRPDASMFNRFTVPAMAQEFRHLTDPGYLGERLIYEHAPGIYYDSHLAPNQRRGDLGYIRDRRWMLRETLGEHLARSECVIMTLGLSQSIYDREAGIHLNSVPPARFANQHPDRFEGRFLSFSETLAGLEEIRALLPGKKIVVTVSPVALQKSFDTRDIVTANAASKAVLRAAADEFASRHDDVDYFPSYEIAMHNGPRKVFQWDFRHVRPKVVEHITGVFLHHYLT